MSEPIKLSIAELSLEFSHESKAGKQVFKAERVNVGEGMEAYVTVYRAAPTKVATAKAPSVRKGSAIKSELAGLVATLSPEKQALLAKVMAQLNAEPTAPSK